MKILTTLPLFLLLLIPVIATADTLSELPQEWKNTLQPVSEVDMSNVDKIMQHEIESTRQLLSDFLLTKNPDTEKHADAWGKLGALYQLRKIDTVAQACFTNASTLEPDNMRWHYYLAWLALSTGRSADALTHLEKVQQLDPSYMPQILRRAEANLGLNKLQQARKDFETATAERGLHAASEFGLGQVALLQRRYQDAVKHFTAALEQTPEAGQIHYPLAQALRALGKTDEAREHLKLRGEDKPMATDPLVEALNRLDKGPYLYYEQGMSALNEQRYNDAVTLFAKGLKFDPDNNKARVSYARVLYLSGEKQRAREELLNVLKADEKNILAQFLVGLLDDAAGKIKEATQAYQLILKLDPTHSGAQFYLAARLFKDKQYKEAAEHYAIASKSDPDNTPAKLFHVIALSHAGINDNEIKQRLEGILKKAGSYSPAIYALIRLLIFSKEPTIAEPTKALQLANTLVENGPFPPFLEMQALAYAVNGEYDRAVEMQLIMTQMIGMMAPEKEYARMMEILDAFKEKHLPEQAIFPETDMLLSPAAVDPSGPFRNYPAANPY
ncbi:MAG: tetratricopeptide repeat protein [Gammaproteobacteria bacterium]|nr:MAG: tetratricopeptide repeat protein [Gammaproteobacteria bacterium]